MGGSGGPTWWGSLAAMTVNILILGVLFVSVHLTIRNDSDWRLGAVILTAVLMLPHFSYLLTSHDHEKKYLNTVLEPCTDKL